MDGELRALGDLAGDLDIVEVVSKDRRGVARRRWAAVEGQGFALKAESPDTFSMNASVYTQEELAKKMHDYELEPCGETVFCVDYKLSGVGSNSCGPMLLPEYQLNEEAFSFQFGLTPCESK